MSADQTDQDMAAAEDQQPKKILLVEDDQGLANVYIVRLEAEGFITRHVDNGEEALSNAIEFKPDLIFLDVMMPDMDGQNALQGIRAIEQSRNIATGQGMRILMVSALNDSETVLNAFRSECDGYLTKPINRQKLFTELIKFQLIET